MKNSCMNYEKATQKGFTLVELLVVISIIALLLSVLMPALGRARAQGRQVVCKSQLRQIGIAFLLYAQSNRDYAVPGRWHNGGDWLSVNTWYSNLTPYLDEGKSSRKVYLMTAVDARKYNRIWTKLICPAEHSKLTQTEFEGVRIRTYGINTASTVVPGATYYDGFGFQDWNRGELRKLSSIKHPAEMMAFCDVRDFEYVYAGVAASLNTPERWNLYLPKRHPGEYSASFADGHIGNITTKQLKDDKNRIWRAY